MKRFLVLVLFSCHALINAQTVNICSLFYAVSNNTAYICTPDASGNSTLVPVIIPTGASGMALGPAFAFQAPNPTLWTTIGGNYWYFNGLTFVNTNHSAGLFATNPGGSANFLYNLSVSGQVYKYDGTGNATLLTTFTVPTFMINDVVGDDKDNFYILRLNNAPVLNVYNPQGVRTCSYSVSGLGALALTGNALAIVENTVTVRTQNGYYVGVMNSGAISFTQVSASFGNPSDFASCPRTTSFTSGITASPSASVSCSNSIITLSVTPNAGYTASFLSWSGPGIIGPPPNSSTVLVNSAGTYSCFLLSCEGGTSIATFTVHNGFANPTLQITASAGTICAGNSATLTASGATSYTWLPGSSNGSVIVVNPTLSTTYTITGTDANHCFGSDSVSIIVNPSPALSAVSNPTALCYGGSATLSVNGTASTYTWFPGNLQGTSVVVQPGSTTTYTVVGSGITCTAQATVTILNPSSPSLVVSGKTLTCLQPTLDFMVIPGSVNDVISWTGPGITPPNSSTLLNVTVPGTYTLVVTNTLANCISLDSIQVTNAIGPLSLNVVSSDTQLCVPSNNSVNILASTPGFCSWLPSAGLNTSSGPLVVASPTATTVYTVIATLGICTSSSAITISVNPVPLVLVPVNSMTMCAGTAVALSASGAGSYTWSPGNLSGTSVTVQPGTNTVYTVTGEAGNCFSSATVNCVVLPAPYLTPTVWPVIICPGKSSTLSVNNALTYTWLPGALTSASIVVNPTITSQYTVSGSGSNGCISASVIPVTVYEAPQFVPAVLTGSLCRGDSTILAAGGNYTFVWFPGALAGNSVYIKPVISTIYTVVANNTVCVTERTIQVSVGECQPPPFGITNAASPPKSQPGDAYEITFTITLTNNGTENLSGIKLRNNLRATFPAPGVIRLPKPAEIISRNSALLINPFYDGVTDIEITNSLQSTMNIGKRDTIVFTILYEPRGFFGRVKNHSIAEATFFNNAVVSDTSNNGFVWDENLDGNPRNDNKPTFIDINQIDFFIPGGFSPDGDNLNDRFVIKGLYGRPVRLSIYNRWGNKVYENESYDNSWDGKSNTGFGWTGGDGKLPASTYYYILEFKDGGKETKTGFVVINY